MCDPSPVESLRFYVEIVKPRGKKIYYSGMMEGYDSAISLYNNMRYGKWAERVAIHLCNENGTRLAACFSK